MWIMSILRVHFSTMNNFSFLCFVLRYNLKSKLKIVIVSKNELQLTQQCFELNVMMRFLWFICESCFFNHDSSNMISYSKISMTKFHNCFLCFSNMIFILIACVIWSSKKSSINFKFINCNNSIWEILCCLTKRFFTYDKNETFEFVKHLIFWSSFFVTILIFQFNWRSLTMFEMSLNVEKINLIVTKRNVFDDAKFSNSRILLRKFLNFCFQTRRCSKIFNFSNRYWWNRN